ncbi:hypothetical protein BBR01nite_10390 [Brevibacillus brevis]|nr:hypothetical protein BBR01nite_10390 [Brevibacillus brevis]
MDTLDGYSIDEDGVKKWRSSEGASGEDAPFLLVSFNFIQKHLNKIKVYLNIIKGQEVEANHGARRNSILGASFRQGNPRIYQEVYHQFGLSQGYGR